MVLPLLGATIGIVNEYGAAQMDQLHKVYISYDHQEDTEYYDRFRWEFHPQAVRAVFSDICPLVFEEDLEYTLKRLRGMIAPAGVTVVLCGKNTWGQRYVDLEIMASLQQQKGLVGIYLPTAARNAEGKFKLPARLRDNLHSRYASMLHWEGIVRNPTVLGFALTAAAQTSKELLDNRRPPRLSNAYVRPADGPAQPGDRLSRLMYWLPRARA